MLVIGLLGCFLAGLFAGRWAIIIVFSCEIVFGVVIMLWAAAVAPLSLNNSRRNGSLELLLCTPLTAQDIVRGQVDALYGYFMAPALIVAVGCSIVGTMGLGIGRNPALGNDGAVFAFGLFWFAYFILNLHALAYTGLWNGLTNARVDRAIAKTVFAVLLLPWITLIVPVLGCLGLIGWPIFWLYWSSGRLKLRFRTESVKQFAAAEESGWLPWRS
jgi:ABC-type Na+ efflux pump permease subunit